MANEPTTSPKLSIIQKINQVSPAQLATIPEVADRFMELYSVMHGKNSELSKIAYEAEKFHFMKLLQDKPDLQKCTKLSLYGCFIDMAVQGLSFDPAMKHAYVVGFPTKVVTNGVETWETRACLMIDGRGELIIRTRQGQIKYADNPVLVWEGDFFKYGTKNDKVYLEHEAAYPRKKEANIMACYLRIERPDSSVDYKVFGIEDVNRLREFSKQKNSLAWTSGFSGMVETKTMKHAFKSYPKVKIVGNFSKLTTEEDDQQKNIDYGLDGQETAVAPKTVTADVPYVDAEEIKDPPAVVKEDSFIKEKPAAAATKVMDDEDF